MKGAKCDDRLCGTWSLAMADLALAPPDQVFLAGTGTNRALAFLPALGRHGTTTVTVIATDGEGLSTSTTFQLTVAGPSLLIEPPRGPENRWTLTWPKHVPSFGLERTRDLAKPDWQPVQSPATTQAGLRVVQINTTDGTWFYRLRRP